MGLLILSLGHTPLPSADYHNIRHHDGPGEVCPYHDHLLAWHPDAKVAEDVAVLHWHWFLPLPGGSNAPDGRSGILSRVPDWSSLTWTDNPQVAPESRVRFVGRAMVDDPTLASLPIMVAVPLVQVRAGPRSSHTFSATFAPRVRLTSLLQRWVC
jgi:hypothetical protein